MLAPLRTGHMIGGARRLASMLAEQCVPVYAYRFAYVAASVARSGAPRQGAP